MIETLSKPVENIGEKTAGTGGGEVDWGKKIDVSKLRDDAGGETPEVHDWGKPVDVGALRKNAEHTLTDADREQIIKETGWSKEIVDAIDTREEYEVYKNAGLHEEVINGKHCLVKDNIDMDQKDEFSRTNKERMEAGLAPLDENGKPIELHHIGQKADGPLAELTQDEHRGKGNDTVLHDKLEWMSNMVHGKGASGEDIAAAEKALLVKFADEYKAYLSCYGAASAGGVELTGLLLSKRLDVVSVTKAAREEAHIPSDMYVVNNTGFEGILMLQNSKGEVFEAMGGKVKKAFDSLAAYLENAK